MFLKIFRFVYSKYRAFAPLSCLESPRPDLVRGFERWKWLTKMRQTGRFLDPSVEIRCFEEFENRLSLGKGSALDRGVIVWLGDECGMHGEIKIGEKSYLGPYCFIGSCHKLEIGENTLIGANCYLITVNHRRDHGQLPIIEQGYAGASINIGNNVWLGAHVVVLPGISIGNNSVVGAGAVVTKDIPCGETWAGVPACKIS